MFFAFSQVVGGSFCKGVKVCRGDIDFAYSAANRLPELFIRDSRPSVQHQRNRNPACDITEYVKIQIGNPFIMPVGIPDCNRQGIHPRLPRKSLCFLHIRIQNLVISAALISAYYPQFCFDRGAVRLCHLCNLSGKTNIFLQRFIGAVKHNGCEAIFQSPFYHFP